MFKYDLYRAWYLLLNVVTSICLPWPKCSRKKVYKIIASLPVGANQKWSLWLILLDIKYWISYRLLFTTGSCTGWYSLLDHVKVDIHYWITYRLIFTTGSRTGWYSILYCVQVDIHYWIAYRLIFTTGSRAGWYSILDCVQVDIHYWIAYRLIFTT